MAGTSGCNLVYIQCYLFTIAFMVGTGVLGVPVTLARSGLAPGLVLFTLGLGIQIVSVCHVVDILQKSVIIRLQNNRNSTRQPPHQNEDTIPLTSTTSGDEESDPVHDQDVNNVPATDLHTLGETFLPPPAAILFDFIVLPYLMSFGVLHGIAGSIAIVQLFKTRITTTMVVFCWTLNFVVMAGRRVILHLTGLLTLAKATALIVTTLVAFVVGSQIDRDIQTDFSYSGTPFVISTVMLGGCQVVMPYLFSKITFGETQIRSFRLSLILALLTCFMLNIFWAWAVLDVVPQYNICEQVEDNSTVTQCLTHFNYTLLEAEKNGQTATIPFQQVINESYPQYNWIATLISVFVLGSITVAYMTTTTTAVHTVEEAVSSLWPKDKWRCLDFGEHISTESAIGNFLSLVMLSMIFAVIINNPKGFLIIMESASTLLINIINGIFMSWMFWRGARKEYSHLEIPLPLPKVFSYAVYPVAFYFNLALIYNIIMLALQTAG